MPCFDIAPRPRLALMFVGLALVASAACDPPLSPGTGSAAEAEELSVVQARVVSRDLCQTEEGVFVPCEGPGGGGPPRDTGCLETRRDSSYFYQLPACTPERRRQGVRCSDQCITNLCQVYDEENGSVAPTPCPERTKDPVSIAYKIGFDFWFDSKFDHTYFCLSSKDGQDCHTIVSFGVDSRKAGGQEMPGTRRVKSNHQRCLAESRSSNFAISACGTGSQFYGINGVCHQHTNRGQLSMHDTFTDPDLLLGGGFSFLAYGPYGNTWPVCFAGSELFCALAKVIP